MNEAETGAPQPAARRTVLLTVAYDGRRFSGWARQPNARTVAGELDGAVLARDPSASRLRGTSRTDAGVHARCQLAAFDTSLSIPPRGWVMALTRELPDEIALRRAAVLPLGYDPRGHVRWKRYRYTLLLSPVRDPFAEGRAWRLADELALEPMREEAAALLGTQDFRAFRGAADEREDTMRTLTTVRMEPRGPFLDVVVEGDRFMYHMVRIIVGALVDVGRGRLASGAMSRALSSGDRRALGVTAPPDGLCLEHVELEPLPLATSDDVWPSPDATW